MSYLIPIPFTFTLDSFPHMNVTDLLSKLTTKAQVNFDDPKFAAIKELKGDFPDEEGNKILSALMTFDDAKNNYQLKNHFIAAILDPADQEINKIMEEKGLSVEDKSAISAEKSTYKKIGALVNKIEKLEEQKAGATSGEKKELQTKINEATSKIAELNKSHADEIKRIHSEFENKLTDSEIKSFYSAKDYADKTIDHDVLSEAWRLQVHKELEKLEGKVVKTNKGLELKNAKDDSLDWISPSGEKMNYGQFADSYMAAKKAFAVSNPASNGATNGATNGNIGAPIVQGVKPFNSGTFDSKLDQKIAEAERNVR